MGKNISRTLRRIKLDTGYFQDKIMRPTDTKNTKNTRQLVRVKERGKNSASSKQER